ncbi:hypothetical protein [Pseudoalteromonas piscicida]|uniref:hypothetical protein n=1 Tax=Pseudoalteromonas piscicida TaxID=43662 RepID=UPI0027E4FFA8|nr:hypothetical protein [Pseudoalteromonas piscicida]WMO15384.1 hypothetical protein NI376_07290 [Pseudoalteromonas piscicida]
MEEVVKLLDHKFFITELVKIILTLLIPSLIAGLYWLFTLRHRSGQILQVLQNRSLYLHFAGETQSQAKEITFENDGNIGKGKNHNETYWKVRFGKLKIFNQDKKLFSVFKWDQSVGQLKHTNDPSLPSVMGQFIVPFVTGRNEEQKHSGKRLKPVQVSHQYSLHLHQNNNT